MCVSYLFFELENFVEISLVRATVPPRRLCSFERAFFPRSQITSSGRICNRARLLRVAEVRDVVLLCVRLFSACSSFIFLGISSPSFYVCS